MLRRERDIFLTSLMFFTRIPVPAALGYTYDASYLQKSSRYLPLIGWLVGGIAAGVYWLAALWLPAVIAVALSMAASLLVTGAFHEDGWADTWDGLGGGTTPERVLAIMKDSRVGAYGAIALMMMLGGKAAALTELTAHVSLPLCLWAGHSVSRLAAVSLIYTHDYMRLGEDSKVRPLTTRMSGRSLLFALFCGGLPLLFLPAYLWWAVGGVIVVRVGLAHWFVRRLGGYTGDCLGAVQQAAELAFYVLLIGLSG